MVPSEFISDTSGFPEGFRYMGHNLAANFTAIGELIVLPLVVLVTILAQPRLNYTLALDGILPRNFAQMDDKGNLQHGIKYSGFVLVLIATFVPFRFLDDLISSGILIAFTLTDTSVILVRHESPKDNPRLLKTLLAFFHSLSFVSGLFVKSMLSASETRSGQRAITFALTVAAVAVATKIRQCPSKVADERRNIFLVPCVPTIPLCGCFVSLRNARFYLDTPLNPLFLPDQPAFDSSTRTPGLDCDRFLYCRSSTLQFIQFTTEEKQIRAMTYKLQFIANVWRKIRSVIQDIKAEAASVIITCRQRIQLKSMRAGLCSSSGTLGSNRSLTQFRRFVRTYTPLLLDCGLGQTCTDRPLTTV